MFSADKGFGTRLFNVLELTFSKICSASSVKYVLLGTAITNNHRKDNALERRVKVGNSDRAEHQALIAQEGDWSGQQIGKLSMIIRQIAGCRAIKEELLLGKQREKVIG